MASPTPQVEALPTYVQNENVEPANELIADDDDVDSAYNSSAAGSETTSIASVYKGYFENGRRYQSVRSEDYLMPTDEKQWESMSAGHMMMLILDSQRRNTLFQSPISAKARHIIDLGTGSGDWAIDVADRYPSITVNAVDLYPPPQQWTAPNCIYEVDDITSEWTWSHKFDLVHIRHLLGGLSVPDWKKLYERIYANLEPGGWIEQVEMDIGNCCDDGTLPADSMLVTQWRTMFIPLAERAGRPLNIYDTMQGRIEDAGFINVHQQDYKCPVGTWPKQQVYKDAGRACKEQYKSGMEGWVMWLLTKYGEPEPWTPEQVQVYLAGIRKEIDAGYHFYQKIRRVWAQKPFDKPTADSKASQNEEAETVA